MSNNEPSDERSNDLQITVCENGVVNVLNTEGDDHSAHSVFLDDDGDVLRCSCPGHRYHADAIESRPLVVASAQAANATYTPVATDGGQPADEQEQADDDETETCEHGVEGCPGAASLPDELPRVSELPSSSAFCDDCQPVSFERLYGSAETDGGDIEATQPNGEPSDANYCAKYLVPCSECVLTDGEGCPHGVITAEDAETDGGRIDTGQETCARCSKPLAEAHAEPAGYTAITTDGDEMCDECAEARR